MAYNLPVDYTTLPQWERRRVREQYIEEQGGMCYHCGESLSSPAPGRIRTMAIDWRQFPPNFLKYPVHLHHSHETGLTIGAVHSNCNAVLWQYYGE